MLQNFVDKYEKEKIVIMGDMNGHTGILWERVNKNGDKLSQFADINGLEILNHTMGEGKVAWKGI